MKKLTFLLLLLTTPCFSGQIPANGYPGMIMLYHFNENAGTKVSNSYRAGASTTVYSGNFVGGATFQPASKLGSAVSLDGVNDYIDLDFSRELQQLTTFTALAMVKWDASGNSTQQAIWHIYQTGTGVGLSLESGFEPTIHVGGDYYHVMGPILVSNRWTVLVGAWFWDGPGKSFVEGYRDGVFTGSKTVANLPTWATEPGAINRIGTRSDNSFFFAGQIDEFAVFNRRLTAGEIKEISNELLGRKHGAQEQ